MKWIELVRHHYQKNVSNCISCRYEDHPEDMIKKENDDVKKENDEVKKENSDDKSSTETKKDQ